MAVICPFADWRPLPEATSQGRINPRVVIFHTAVGTLRGVERYFRELTGIESHMMVGGPWDGPALDGAIWQWMDLSRRADANLDANNFAISIETSDNHPQFPSQIEPWSPKQLVSLVRVGNWLADRFDIPRRQCPRWDASGFGWHAMWGSPSHWTPVRGKVCPADKRIHQLKTIVLPAIFAGRELDEVEEDDMYDEAAEQRLKDWVEGRLDVHQEQLVAYLERRFGNVPAGGVQESLSTMLHGERPGRESIDTVAGDTQAILAGVNDIKGELGVEAPPQ